MNFHAMWPDLSDGQRATMLDELARAGVKWVRLDVAWATLQPDGPGSYDMGNGVARLQSRLDEIAARGMKTLVMLYWAPRWASGTSAKNGVPRNPADFGNMAAWVAQHFAGKVHAIELWNEPDLPDYLADTSVATYTKLVKAAYPRIKAANPAVTVVAGSPTAINTNWYRGFYANGGADSYDALGIHPYLSPSDLPPTACDPKWKMFYPCGIDDLVALMKAHGDSDKQLWATEYGWSAHDNSTYGSGIANWKRGVSQTQQANYLVQMHEVLARWPQVSAAFWYTDRNTATGDAMEDNYGLLRRDLSRKPVFYAMKCAAAGICGPASAGTYVASGATWRYANSGADLGTAWRGDTYDDSGWRSGAAQLGYGDGDEATVLAGSTRPITTYFRTSFDAGSSLSGVTTLTLRAIVDDGAVVYLNGREIWRTNLPTGTITASTRATVARAGSAESAVQTVSVPVTALRTGRNVLAAEVHNSSSSSSDVSWLASLSR